MTKSVSRIILIMILIITKVKIRKVIIINKLVNEVYSYPIGLETTSSTCGSGLDSRIMLYTSFFVAPGSDLPFHCRTSSPKNHVPCLKDRHLSQLQSRESEARMLKLLLKPNCKFTHFGINKDLTLSYLISQLQIWQWRVFSKIP